MENKTAGQQGIWGSFHTYAAITIAFWSLAYVLTRLALQHFSALSLGFLRYAVASVVLAVVCVTRRIPPPKLRDVPWFIASGMAGFCLYMVAFNIGTSYVTAATSSVVIASVPIFTALMAAMVFKEKLARHQWAAIAVEFAGILVLTLYGGVFSVNKGVLWLLLASVMLSVNNLLQRKLTRTYSAMQATAYSIFIGALGLGVFAPGAVEQVATAPPSQLVYVLLMGVFSSALAFVAWAKAFELAPRTSMVSNYMFLTPFITGVLGFFMVGERPEPSTWIGGVFIIGGSILFNRQAPAVRE